MRRPTTSWLRSRPLLPSVTVRLGASRRCARARRDLCALLLAAVAAVAACGGGGDGTAPPSTSNVAALSAINVSIPVTQLRVGDTTVARATGVTASGATVSLESPAWSSDAPEVLAVGGSGVVTASAEGEATLIARAGGKEGTLRLRIQPQPVRKIVLSRPAITLAPTVSLTLFATTLGAGDNVLSNRVVSWSTSNAAVATVSPQGTVTGVSQGSATVTATSEGVTAVATVTVTSGVGSVARIVLNAPTATLTAGERLQLSALAYDATGAALPAKAIAWSASVASGSNPATISDSGLVSARAAGIVIVEAESEGVTAAVVITVRDNVDPSIGLSFSMPVKNELIGDTLAIELGVQTAEHVEKVEVKLLSNILQLTRSSRSSIGTEQEVWITRIDVTDIPTGFYELVATATVSRGAIGRGTITFQRDTRVGKGGFSQPPKQK